MNTPMKSKPFIVANVRDILGKYDREEISFSGIAEMLNEVAFDWANAKDEEIEKLMQTLREAYVRLSSLLRKTTEYPTNSLLEKIEVVCGLDFLENRKCPCIVCGKKINKTSNVSCRKCKKPNRNKQ